MYYHKKIVAAKLTTTAPISTNHTTMPATNLIKNTMTSDVTAINQHTKLSKSISKIISAVRKLFYKIIHILKLK